MYESPVISFHSLESLEGIIKELGAQERLHEDGGARDRNFHRV